MSDDSFIREVDEELRQDRLQSLWSSYGRYAIGVAVLIVLATAGYRGWEYYSHSRAAASGDQYQSALDLSQSGNRDEALAELEKLADDGSGQYPALARMRIGAELAGKGDKQGAIEHFEAIAADSSYDEALRNVARLRAGYLAVDTESYDEVKQRLEPLAGAGGQYRSLAREALGLSAIKAGELQAAHDWFNQIANDAGATQNVRQRAALMLDFLAGKGVSAAS